MRFGNSVRRIISLTPRVLLLLLSFVSGPANGQDSPLLQKVRKNFNSLNGLQVKYAVRQAGRDINSGMYFYKKPGKSRIEAGNFIIISDGKSTWNINRSTGKVVISNFKSGDMAGGSLSDLINTYPSLCDVTEQTGADGNYLFFKPKASGLNFRSAKCRVTKDMLISHIEVVDRTGAIFEIAFSQYKTAIVPEEKLFSYKPQEGEKVIDLR